MRISNLADIRAKLAAMPDAELEALLSAATDGAFFVHRDPATREPRRAAVDGLAIVWE